MYPFIQIDEQSAILYSIVIAIAISLLSMTIEHLSCKFYGLCLWSKKPENSIKAIK